MPQSRHLLARTRALIVERVHFHERHCEWSPVYEAPGTRLVLPSVGTFEWRMRGGQTVLADALTAFRVGGATLYQMRSCVLQERTSVVISETTGASRSLLPAGMAAMLSPRALYRWRLHWRALQDGTACEAQTLELAASSLSSTALPVGDGPAGRARRFLAADARALARCSLEEVAEAACSSPFHLSRAFRRLTGLSVQQYRTGLRMAQALARLQEGDRDMAGLAHDLGFCHQSHLGATFRREVGVTPGQARSALAGGSAGI